MDFKLPFVKLSQSPVVRWLALILLIIIVEIGLYFLGVWLNFARIVAPPSFLRGVASFWLPGLGILFVLICFVLYWLYVLLMAGEGASPFPDIDAAWQEATQTLAQAGLRLPDLPLFLVLGRPGTTPRNLFDAAGFELVVKMTPGNPQAPLHVFADHKAVYVTCEGASLLGRLAGILAMEEVAQGSTADQADDPEVSDKTLRPGKKDQKIIEMIRGNLDAASNPLKRRAMRRAMDRSIGPDFLADPAAVQRLKARLAHLCRIIGRDRLPFCPLNGILWLIPLGGTDTPEDAQQAAVASQEDLAVIRRETKLDCPVMAAVVDMEDLPGFVEFMKRNSRELGRRVGQRFPLATKLSRDETAANIGSSISWLCTSYLQDSAYPFFQMEKADQTPDALLPGNANLFLMLDEMSGRSTSLTTIVKQAIAPDNDAAMRYAGCYLAATGAKGSQGFVGGVMQRLIDEQSAVSWTDRARADDADSHTWGWYYTLFAAVLVIGWVGLLGWIIFAPK
jgi:hypothetical protein